MYIEIKYKEATYESEKALYSNTGRASKYMYSERQQTLGGYVGECGIQDNIGVCTES